MTVADRLRTAFAREDFEEMIAVLDEDVVWLGIQPAGEEDPPMCTNRAEVRQTFEWHIDQGNRALPKIVAEGADFIVVEMNLQQPSDVPELHQLLTVRDDRIVGIQDFPDCRSALIAGGLDA